jgi:hypothetical protein
MRARLRGHESWQNLLRKHTSAASRSLIAGNLGDFPLTQTRAIVDGFFDRKRATPRSSEGDALLRQELWEFQGTWPDYEVALTSCLHLLTPQDARVRLRGVQQELVRDSKFAKDRLAVYLGCILLSRSDEGSPTEAACSREEITAAAVLLDVLFGRGVRDTSAARVIQDLINNKHAALLPIDLVVEKTLASAGLWEILGARQQLYALHRDRRWSEARSVISGWQPENWGPNRTQLICAVFPEVPMWNAWRPDEHRLSLWQRDYVAIHRERLLPFFDLEGPDTSGQLLPTCRTSSCNIFDDLAVYSNQNRRHILNHYLNTLDKAIQLGPDGLALFTTALCAPTGALSPLARKQVDAGLSLADPPSAAALAALLRIGPSLPAADADHIPVLTAALAAIPPSSPDLVAAFSTPLDLARHAPRALLAAQSRFLQSTREGLPPERLAAGVAALAAALRAATYLHGERHWPIGLGADLERLLEPEQVRAVFAQLRGTAAPGDPGPRAALLGLLATRVGGAPPTAGDEATPVPDLVPPDPEEAVWSAELDGDRALLRTHLRRLRGAAGTPPPPGRDVATRCLVRARGEHDVFVREVAGELAGRATDVQCVNLARRFGPRAARLDGCWRELLAVLIRRRGGGGEMLARLAGELSPRTWGGWVEDLRRLEMVGDGEVGFSAGDIERLTREVEVKGRSLSVRSAPERPAGVGRSLSAATTSTVGSDVSASSSISGSSTVTRLSSVSGGSSYERLRLERDEMEGPQWWRQSGLGR